MKITDTRTDLKCTLRQVKPWIIFEMDGKLYWKTDAIAPPTAVNIETGSLESLSNARMVTLPSIEIVISTEKI